MARKPAEWNVEVIEGVGKTGIIGELRGKRPGQRMIVLRSDMDALPIQEQTGLPHASTNPDVTHACGHDGHTAMLLAEERYLAD